MLSLSQLVNQRLAASDETSAQDVLTDLIDLARVAPGFLKPAMDTVSQVC